MALPKKFNLSDKSEINKVFREGKVIISPWFNIRFIYTGSKLSRFSVITGLKISKKAVIRNNLKRKISEIIRTNVAKIKAGHDIVLMTKPKILNESYDRLKEILIKELLKIN